MFNSVREKSESLDFSLFVAVPEIFSFWRFYMKTSKKTKIALAVLIAASACFAEPGWKNAMKESKAE